MRWFPHTESMLDHPNTGEDIIAENDEKKIASGERKIQRGFWDIVRNARGRKSNV
jgi:hypothetical protein